MNRSFYSFSFLVNVLIAGLTLVDAGLYLMIGNKLAYLSQYPMWLLLGLFFTAIEGFLMLKYFRAKEYPLASWTGAAAYVFSFFYTLFNYSTLAFSFGGYILIPEYLLTLVLQVVYSITLSVSASKERMWLRAAGWCGLILSLLTFVAVAVIASGKFVEYNRIIDEFRVVLLFIAILPPTAFAMNFRSELNSRDKEVPQTRDIYSYASAPIVIATLCFVFMITVAGLTMKSELSRIDAAFQKVAEPFDARVFVDKNGNSLNYRLLRPLDFDSTKRYPIVVCLHGSSGTGNDNYTQVASALMPEFLAHTPNREKFRAFVFVPQCPFGTSWGGHPLPSIDEIVFEALASLETELPIDSTRRYVTGISLGGYGTWNFITKHPDVFAAAIPICGSGDPTLAVNCVDVPVWAFHGAHDERVDVNRSRDMIKAIKAAGGSPRYTEFPDAGHDIGKMVCDTEGLMEWMFEQKKNGIIAKVHNPNGKS